jgi:hypothetical protein
MRKTKLFNLLTYPQGKTDLFKFEFHKGDEYWKDSIWLTHWWFGKYYWHCLFFEF